MRLVDVWGHVHRGERREYVDVGVEAGYESESILGAEAGRAARSASRGVVATEQRVVVAQGDRAPGLHGSDKKHERHDELVTIADSDARDRHVGGVKHGVGLVPVVRLFVERPDVYPGLAAQRAALGHGKDVVTPARGWSVPPSARDARAQVERHRIVHAGAHRGPGHHAALAALRCPLVELGMDRRGGYLEGGVVAPTHAPREPWRLLPPYCCFCRQRRRLHRKRRTSALSVLISFRFLTGQHEGPHLIRWRPSGLPAQAIRGLLCLFL